MNDLFHRLVAQTEEAYRDTHFRAQHDPSAWNLYVCEVAADSVIHARQLSTIFATSTLT